MIPTLEEAAQEYVDIVNGPLNGWGQCNHPITGAQSHFVLMAGMKAHGQTKFNNAVDAIFRKNKQLISEMVK